MFKEGCRIEIFADELRRRGEENKRNAQTDSTTLSFLRQVMNCMALLVSETGMCILS